MDASNDESAKTSRKPSERWQLGGSSPEAYERYLVPQMFAPWAERLVERLDPEPDERVLDVGCGTGIVARHAAPRMGPDGSVVGLDLNEGMLETARSVSSEVHPAIQWQNGDAREMPFSEETFDVVFCQQTLQFIPNPSAALREMHRVLRPGGRLGLSVWRRIEHNPSYGIMADALERHAGEEAGTMMRSPFPSWSREHLRGLLEEAGFQEVHVNVGIGSMRYPSVAEYLRREAASSPLAGPIGALSTEVREALIQDLTEALQPYVDDDGVVFPMTTHVTVACR